ncbi:MAG TPA: FAD-dependent oxidoreductase [Bradyrhizobium sp.]|nr:FAD-dependent oxidoreductase [Bradyrhizobium sp.]
MSSSPDSASLNGTRCDVAIIGGGIAGLAAAAYAAAAGHSTVLLERFAFENTMGGSGGLSRMFRVMYSDAPNAMLAETSLALWQELEVATGQRVLDRTGLLFYGTDKGGATVEGQLKQCAETMTGLGIPYQRLSREELLSSYPIFRTLPLDYYGLVQHNSAVIHANVAINAFQMRARAAGAQLFDNTPARVSPPSIPNGLYTVTTPGATFNASRIIFCPGSWTNDAIRPMGLQVNLNIWVLSVAYWPIEPGATWPMWYEFGPQISPTDPNALNFYGFPPTDYPGMVKATADFTNVTGTDPNTLDRNPDPRILDQVGTFLTQRFNGIAAVPQDATTCLYAMSADGEMILGTLGHWPRSAIFTGDSGRAFKFAPLLGRILVEFATTGSTNYDISPWAITPKRRIFSGS